MFFVLFSSGRNKVNCSVRLYRTVFSSSRIFDYKDKTAIPANKAGIHTPIKCLWESEHVCNVSAFIDYFKLILLPAGNVSILGLKIRIDKYYINFEKQ